MTIRRRADHGWSTYATHAFIGLVFMSSPGIKF
jgi:hypothetical protein